MQRSHGQVQSESFEVCRVGDAPAQAWDTAEWQERQAGEKPQPGHRHRPVRSAPQRCQGTAEEWVQAQEAVVAASKTMPTPSLGGRHGR